MLWKGKCKSIISLKAEEEKDLECLKNIFLIFKDLVNISNAKLLEILVSEKYYSTLFGALEYNNEISSSHKEIKHREVGIISVIPIVFKN